MGPGLACEIARELGQERGQLRILLRHPSEHNMVFCATGWWDLASGDTTNDARALSNLNLFAPVIDRLQQGVRNTLFLGRLMLNAQGFAANPAFQSGGRPVIDTAHLYFDGGSRGGSRAG